MRYVAAVLLTIGAVYAHNLMPVPAKMTAGQGSFRLDSGFHVELTGFKEARLERAAHALTGRLARQTGLLFQGGGAALTVDTGGASADVQQVGENEAYVLDVTPASATIKAPTVLGALRGMATFAQLVELGGGGFAAPAVHIEDQPRFPWRGLLIDVSRHWIPLDAIKRNLDAMAAVKLNVFHWHLSDDQGFRVESKVFPKLHQMGSDGHYFTQEQVREVIGYARDRGIRVMPEFDIPGHSTSWFVGYPELASGTGPYKIERTFGILNANMDPTREEVYVFLDKFIGEMAGLFPDAYFHIGGDEVTGKEWKESPRIQAWMKEKGLKDNAALQAVFNTRLLKIVSKHGKKMIGWDEILHPDLPKESVIHSWRGQKGLAEAARQGYSGILSFGYYLDLMQPASQHYAIDPMTGPTAALSETEKGRILGGEACEWAELITPQNIDARIWPRMAPIAERLWSAQSVRDVDDMYRRMAAVSKNLEYMGLQHRSGYDLFLTRLAGPGPVEPVRVLAEIVEPVKQYKRHDGRKYTQFTPLNRMVDTARPESEQARAFGKAVDRYLKDGSGAAELRRWLILWRDNDAAFQKVAAQSELLKEVAPVSRDVAALAALGLKALDGVKGLDKAPVTKARKPQAELLISIANAVGRLVK